MARTYRKAYTPSKSHHRNAIPYKRGDQPNIPFVYRGGIQIIIEEDDRY